MGMGGGCSPLQASLRWEEPGRLKLDVRQGKKHGRKKRRINEKRKETQKQKKETKQNKKKTPKKQFSKLLKFTKNCENSRQDV